MVKSNIVSIILINCMAAERLNVKVARVIGGNTMSIRKKDMGRHPILKEQNTWGNSRMAKDMVMEHIDSLMVEYIAENT